jgi:hypothetical protein
MLIEELPYWWDWWDWYNGFEFVHSADFHVEVAQSPRHDAELVLIFFSLSKGDAESCPSSEVYSALTYG